MQTEQYRWLQRYTIRTRWCRDCVYCYRPATAPSPSCRAVCLSKFTHSSHQTSIQQFPAEMSVHHTPHWHCGGHYVKKAIPMACCRAFTHRPPSFNAIGLLRWRTRDSPSAISTSIVTGFLSPGGLVPQVPAHFVRYTSGPSQLDDLTLSSRLFPSAKQFSHLARQSEV